MSRSFTADFQRDGDFKSHINEGQFSISFHETVNTDQG